MRGPLASSIFMGCCIPPLYKIIYLYVVCAHKNVPMAYGCHSYNIWVSQDRTILR